MFVELIKQRYLIGFCLVLSALCHAVFVHVGADVIKIIPTWHNLHMTNTAPAPLQYRWLSYSIPELMRLLGINLITAYLALRFIYLALAFFFVARLTRYFLSDRLAPVLSVALLALYYAASTQAHLQPSEELNLFLFSLMIYLVITQRRLLWLSVVLVAGGLNKDTIGFLIPFVLLVGIFIRQDIRKAIYDAAVLSVLFIFVYVGLRAYFGTGRDYLGGVWQAKYNLEYFLIHPFTGSLWMIPSLLPFLLAMYQWKKMPVAVKCFMPTVALFILGHLLISRIDEFRTFSALAAVTFPMMIQIYLHSTVTDDGVTTPRLDIPTREEVSS